VLYAAMEYELFAAEKRVAEAVSGLKEGTMHRNAFFSLRRVVRVLEELRMVELKALGMALVETGEEGVEEEEALGWRFESFYGVLEVLEGRSERSYGLADVAHESLGVRSGGSEGEDMVEPEVDGKKAGKGEFGSRGEQGAEILKAEPANGVEGLEVIPIATGEGAGL